MRAGPAIVRFKTPLYTDLIINDPTAIHIPVAGDEVYLPGDHTVWRVTLIQRRYNVQGEVEVVVWLRKVK